jgi:hypothetical protein
MHGLWNNQFIGLRVGIPAFSASLRSISPFLNEDFMEL